MGAACCVPAKSKPVSDEANVLVSRISTQCSPLWNVQWDNRGRVAGEETAVRCFADMSSRDSQLGNISETEVRTVSGGESSERSISPLPEEGIHIPDFRSPNSGMHHFLLLFILSMFLHVSFSTAPQIPRFHTTYRNIQGLELILLIENSVLKYIFLSTFIR